MSFKTNFVIFQGIWGK